MSKVVAPFKGRPATDLLKYLDSVLCGSSSIESFAELTDYLLEIDADCSLSVQIEESTENPTGLTPAAMVEKMDLLLRALFEHLNRGVSDEFFMGALRVFEHSVLKLHRPHYIQFVTFCLACSSKDRADKYLSFLLNIIHDDSSDPISRREAIGYVGSFVCRANHLSWSHSARSGKYLLSFMTTVSSRALLVITLQTLCYMIIWESDRWDANSMELDWVYRSRKGLVSLISNCELNLFRLISIQTLNMLFPVIGRFSSQLKQCVAEAIRDRNELIPSGWKPYVSEFPFDTNLLNLIRSKQFILPLLRQWQDPTLEFEDMNEHIGPAAKLDDDDMEDEDVWCYRNLLQISSPAFSPIFSPAEFPPEQSDTNIVLNRILSMLMDQALISTPTGIFSIDVSTGNVGWQLNDTNGATVISSLVDRVFCAPHGNKALIHYWKLNKESLIPESSGNPIYKCSTPEKFSSIVFSSCGGLLFAAAVSGTMYVWQTWTGNLLKSWTAHFGIISKIVLNSDDSILVTGSEDTSVKLWDLSHLFAQTDGVVKPKISLQAHSLGITDLVLLDDKTLITSSKDMLVKKFRIESNNIVQEQKWLLTSVISKIAFAFNRLFVGCDNGEIFELRDTLVLLGSHSGKIAGLGVSLDGSRIVSCAVEGVKIWDTNAKVLIYSIVGPQQQLKGALGLMMTTKVEQRGEDRLVSGIDSYLQFKPLSRILTKIASIDKIPLVNVFVSQKVKSDKQFCVGIDEVSDPTTKLTAELAKHKQLAQVWAATAADLVLQVAALNGGDVSLDLPIKKNMVAEKKRARH